MQIAGEVPEGFDLGGEIPDGFGTNRGQDC